MDAKKPETKMYQIDLTQNEIRKLTAYSDAKPTDSVNAIILKAIKKITQNNFIKYNNGK